MFNKTTNANFKKFGTIHTDNLNFENEHIYNFNNKSVNSLKFTYSENTYIHVITGVVMLLVSSDTTSIQSFIINRTIKLHKDIYFNLISISDESSIYIISDIVYMPDISLKQDYTYSSISPSLNIKEIYTKFYQEKGLNYNFIGESHPYWELTYVDKGNLSTIVDGTSYTLKQGDLMFYAPLQFHTQFTINNNTSSYLTINFNMDFNNHDMLCNKVFTLNRNSYNITTSLINELSSENIYSNDLSLCYLKQLIIQTLRLENNYSQDIPTTHMQQTYENDLLNKILIFISSNINEKLCIDIICTEFCISSSMLHSLFKKNMNNTVKNYINELKLNKSKELIKTSRYTLSEISEMLGFSSIHYFSRKFKSFFGICPTEYSKSIYE